MAVIRNTASALRKGKVGNETYYVSLNKQIVRVAQNDSNYGESASRTQRQQNNRVKWANLVNFYKLSKAWMRKAFETKKSNQTDYNRFMQLNLSNSRIYLTKDAAMASAVVVDAFVISQGSLRSINITSHDTHWDTDILLGSLTIDASTSVAEFSTAVIAANNWAKEGMQISFISYQQDVDQFGFPVAICTAYEVTLDLTDASILRDHLPDFCSQSDANGRLGTSSNISVGAFAYVLSQTVGGRTLVSTQNLIANNDSFISQYSSAAALTAATESYGVQSDVFLDSGSQETEASPQPFYIQYANVDGLEKTFRPGSTGPTRTETSGKEVTFKMSTLIPSGVTLVKVEEVINDIPRTMTNSSISTTDRTIVTATSGLGGAESRILQYIITLSNGVFKLQLSNNEWE